MFKQPLGPHRQHYFALDSATTGRVFSHVRLKTYPDGGLKRLRVYGRPTPSPLPVDTIPALPLTVEAFRPFGSVIQGFSLDTSAPTRARRSSFTGSRARGMGPRWMWRGRSRCMT